MYGETTPTFTCSSRNTWLCFQAVRNSSIWDTCFDYFFSWFSSSWIHFSVPHFFLHSVTDVVSLLSMVWHYPPPHTHLPFGVCEHAWECPFTEFIGCGLGPILLFWLLYIHLWKDWFGSIQKDAVLPLPSYRIYDWWHFSLMVTCLFQISGDQRIRSNICFIFL